LLILAKGVSLWVSFSEARFAVCRVGFILGHRCGASQLLFLSLEKGAGQHQHLLVRTFSERGVGGAGVQCFPSVFWYMFVYEMCVCVSVKLVYVKFVSVSGLCMFVYLRCEVCMSVCVCEVCMSCVPVCLCQLCLKCACVCEGRVSASMCDIHVHVSVCVCMYEIFMCMFVICVHADVLPV